MSFLSVLGADAKADGEALLSSFAQDDLGKIVIDVVTVAEDGVERLIDPTDQAQLDAAIIQLLNDAELAGKDIGALIKVDLQALVVFAVQAATAAAVAAAASAA
jgi:hypothetical protein